jgi:CheY-like chemotaxis protein
MPKTLLLADDSVTIQKVVGISFANEDVVLITVDNGDDAMLRAREVRPDLVLADVAMPGKDGYEVCEAIKADPQLRHVPVLLLSGTFESFDDARARRVGADGHITKPFEAQALVDRVNELLAHAETVRPVGGGSDTTVLVAERPSVSGDAFDFFDEEFAETVPASKVSAATTVLQADDDASFPEMPIELEAAVEDDLAEAPEAIAIANFDEDLDAPAADGNATMLFDAEPPPVALHATETLFAASELDEPIGQPSSSSAATQLFEQDEVAFSPPLAAPATSFDEAFDFSFEGESEPIAAPPVARETAATERALEPEPEPAAELFEAELEAVVSPPPVPVSAPEQPAANLAVPSGAHIEVMRQELHQHLEKIAWEAFGDLSERIVRETLSRIEAIAWEVIPQMAETLIREEIRRLQDSE